MVFIAQATVNRAVSRLDQKSLESSMSGLTFLLTVSCSCYWCPRGPDATSCFVSLESLKSKMSQKCILLTNPPKENASSVGMLNPLQLLRWPNSTPGRKETLSVL